MNHERLADAIGGRVFLSAREYRQAVDSELFGLGEDRYSALMDLLIALRQPQLSRKLEEERLARTLTQALPRLSDSLLSELADAFRSLENERSELKELEATLTSLERFLKRYRRYLQVACLRQARSVRESHNRYENTLRRQRESNTEAEEVGQRLAELEEQTKGLGIQTAAARQTIRSLEQSREMQDAARLDEARKQVEERSRRSREAEERWERCRRQLTRAQKARIEAEETCNEQLSRIQGRLQAIAGSWSELGMAPAPDLDALQLAQKQVKERDAQAQALKKPNRDVMRAEREWSDARRQLEELQGELNERRASEREAERSLLGRAVELLNATREWLDSLRELQIELDFEDLQSWAEDAESLRSAIDRFLPAACK